KLRELNPDFDGNLEPKIENGMVTGLSLNRGNGKITDISPLQALSTLQTLDCSNNSRLSDLRPLTGMKLIILECNSTGVSDLTPLAGMPLTGLYLAKTKVTDLTPLVGMPLKTLYCDFDVERDATVLRSIKTLESINHKPVAELLK